MSPNNTYFTWKDGLGSYLDTKQLVQIYTMNHISKKLFDLAVNQLLLNVPRFAPYRNHNLNCDCNIHNNHKSGVFVWDANENIEVRTKTIHSLVHELLQLPNQHYCCLTSFRLCTKTMFICILNNNGKIYQNIDWQNMDLNKLICDLDSCVSILQGPDVINCIEYCIRTNQWIFLKKVIYFLIKIVTKEQTWPRYMDEYIMTSLKKYTSQIGCNQYFVDNFVNIIWTVRAECMKTNDCDQLQSIFSARLDKFVKETLKPKLKSQSCKTTIEKNIQLLKQHTDWQCFICKINYTINRMSCTECKKNRSLNWWSVTKNYNGTSACPKHLCTFPAVVPINPYDAFIENDSLLFNITKPFGILLHDAIKFRFIDNNGKPFYIKQFSNFEYQNKDKTVIMVTCEIAGMIKFSILFDEKNSLTIGELKVILYELLGRYAFHVRISKRTELVNFTFKSHETFTTMTDSEIIPPNKFKDYKPYLINGWQMTIHKRIRRKYKIHFGKKHCNYQCPFMIGAKIRFVDKDKNISLDPFKHCPYFSKKFDKNEEMVLEHLSSFDHFVSFDIGDVTCNFHNSDNDCPHYQRIIQNNFNNGVTVLNAHKANTTDQRIAATFQDKKHMYLYYHPSQPKNNFTNSISKDENNKWYDYMPLKLTAIQTHWDQKQLGLESSEPHSFVFILRLLIEVIKNGFIRDLLPETNNKGYILITLESMMYQYQVLTINNMRVDELKNRFNEFCTNTFGIFKQVKQKMNHTRFKQMGSPLLVGEMLALVLYCNGDSNYDLCLSQRDGSCKIKWAMFDSLLNYAISILSQFEEHWENIYSGICGIFYKFRNRYEIRDIVHLKTNVSFTTDLKVAKEFRGSSGMIIGLNMKRSYAATTEWFCACDVSWISAHPREKELLCKRGSEIRFYRNKMTETYVGNEKQQWFVCDEGNLQETSFQAMFPST